MTLSSKSCQVFKMRYWRDNIVLIRFPVPRFCLSFRVLWLLLKISDGSSHFRSHSKQRKSTSVSTPKSPIYSDTSFDDSTMSSANLSTPYVKMEPVFQSYSVPSKSYSSEYSISVKSEPISVKQEESVSQLNELKSPQVCVDLIVNE